MDRIKIVSDGTAERTEVTFGGKTVPGVMRIEFDPLLPGGETRVTLTLRSVELDLTFPPESVRLRDEETVALRTALAAIAEVHPDNTSSMCYVVDIAKDALAWRGTE